MIDLRLLLQFAEVVDSLSFTVAARRLNVAQPWLSVRIRKLEDQLDVTLFERSTRHVVLSDAGLQLMGIVRPLRIAADEAGLAIERMRGEQAALVRIGLPQLGGPDERQSDLIAHFAATHPRISIELEPGSRAVHLERMRSGRLDLAFMLPAPQEAGWETVALYPLALAVMLSGADQLAGPTPLSYGDLAEREIAVFSRRRAPALFDQLYAPLLRVGARLIEVPELRRSLLRANPERLVTTIVPYPANATLRHGVIRRVIADAPALQLHAVRPTGTSMGKPATLFWEAATRALAV